METNMAAKDAIKRARIKLQKNQAEFAKEVKLHKSAISMYERGTRKPSFNTIRELVKKLKVGYVLFKLPKKVGCTYDDIVSAFIRAWPELKQKLKNEKPPYMFVIDRTGGVDKHEKFRR